MREPADQAPLAPTCLPWLAPGAASLIALSRPEGRAWPDVRADPGAVLLLARFSAANSALPFPDDALSSGDLLRFALSRLQGPPAGVVHPGRPGPGRVLQAAALMAYLLSPDAQQRWVSGGGALSVDRRVLDYPNDVAAREAALLGAAEHFRFDGSDLMPPAMNAAFWQAILDFTKDQSRLGGILDHLDAVRATAYGD